MFATFSYPSVPFSPVLSLAKNALCFQMTPIHYDAKIVQVARVHVFNQIL